MKKLRQTGATQYNIVIEFEEAKVFRAQDDKILVSFKGGTMKQKLIAYWKDESGQTSTEYILLVAVAAAIVIKFKGQIEEKLLGDNGLLGKVMSGTTSRIESDLLK